MADRFRLVRIGADGRARAVEDFQRADVNRLQNSTQYAPGAPSQRLSVSTGRLTGAMPSMVTQANGTLSTVLQVRGPAQGDAARRIEAALAAVETATRDLYIEWRPEGLTRSVYSEVRGIGTWSAAYQFARWTANGYVPIQVTWPVAPIPQGLPCAIFERFAPPADMPEGLVNLVQDPNGGGAIYNSSTFVGGAHTRSNASTSPYSGAPYNGAGDSDFQGKGIMVDWSGVPVGAGQLLYAMDHFSVDPLQPGQAYGLRARVKVVNAITNANALTLKIYTVAGGLQTIATAPLAATAYAPGSIIDLAATFAAPIGTFLFGVALDMTGTSAGRVILGRFGIFKVASLAAAVPAYADGDMSDYRWRGTPHQSASLQLHESKLADYQLLSSAAPIERIADGRFHQTFSTNLVGRRAHITREPTNDGEVLVSGRYEAAGSTTYSNFLAPGVRYNPDDGAHIYATVANGNLEIRQVDSNGDNVLATAAITNAPVANDGRDYSLILRSVGHALTAEWYGYDTPGEDRGNFKQRLEFVLDRTSILGAAPDVRAGYPMIRAAGMAGNGRASITRFDWRPYHVVGRQLPNTIELGNVPGTAPALLTPAIGVPGADPTQQFGLVSWAKRARGVNMFTTGDGFFQGGWETQGTAAISANVAVVPGGDAPGDLRRAFRITAGAGADQGILSIWGDFKKGRTYTFEYFAAATQTWNVQLEMYRADLTNVGTKLLTGEGSGGAGYSSWRRRTTIDDVDYSFVAPTDLARIVLRFEAVVPGALDITGIRVWRGTPGEAPSTREQRSGRGGHIPCGAIPGEAMMNPPGAIAGTADVSTVWGNGIIYKAPTTASPKKWQWWVDPAAIDPPDFAGDTVDITFYVLGWCGSGVWPTVLLSAWHETDLAGYSRVYPREFAPDLQRPAATALTASGAIGFVTRAGTLSLSRKSGRYLVEASMSTAAANGDIGVDTLVAVPSWAVASTPTGKATNQTPPFGPNIAMWGSPVPYERRISPDGQITTTRGDNEYGQGGADNASYAYGGLAGEHIEVTPGEVELLLWCYPGMPDGLSQPAAAAFATYGGKGPAVAAWCDVVPRYRLMAA